MNFFQVQDLFKQLHPGKKVSFEFDEKCHRQHEIIYTDGIPNPMHHIENNKVKVSVEGLAPIYVDIIPHRECCTWDQMKKMILSKPDPIS
jgi:hypothetical protein